MVEPIPVDQVIRLRRRVSSIGVAPNRFETELEQIPARDREAWLDALWNVVDLPADDASLPRGCVPYLPCAVATVLEAVCGAEIGANDVFVDVGSGLGRVAALVHLLTGATCLGLEIQPALVEAARERAEQLGLDRLRFVEGDAAELVTDIGVGTVFFLYCPFGGTRLHRFVDGLEDIARARPIRVCCVGMPPLDGAWLEPLPTDDPELVVYVSTPYTHPPT